MPYYLRISLPGPFGYSARIGGGKRRRRTYSGQFGPWECSHKHTTRRSRPALCTGAQT